MCVYYAFTYLLLLSLFSPQRVSLFCGGRLNVCRVLVSYLYCLVVAWVGVVEWEDVLGGMYCYFV
jgi:hypothetical protein